MYIYVYIIRIWYSEEKGETLSFAPILNMYTVGG
jgi:hypothetical protein